MTKKISFDLGGKICVITGGASGIGLAAAKLMAAHACKLVLLDLNWDALNTVKQSLDQCSESPVDIFQLDVCDPVKVKALAEKIEASIGTPDILINSAGIARLNNALETPIEEWRLVMDVNVNGTFYVSQAFGHYMVKRKSGSVINLGSMSGTIINRPQAATSYYLGRSKGYCFLFKEGFNQFFVSLNAF